MATFRALPYDSYKSLSANMVLPLYLIYATVQAIFVLFTLSFKWSKPTYEHSKKQDEPIIDHPAKKIQNASSGVVQRHQQQKVVGNNGQQSHEQQRPKKGLLGCLEESYYLNFVVHMDNRPAECYHLCNSFIFGLLGMLMWRMALFWVPYICIYASAALCDVDLWSLVIAKLNNSESGDTAEDNNYTINKVNRDTKRLASFLRHLVLLFAILILLQAHKQQIYYELEELKEFWDPDTVDLMEWINQNTAPNAAFTGTMQLMAGVRLCTWRPITNHPHFEDKGLRQRTKELYSIYGRLSPEEVYETLVKYNTSYIILEDSHCMSAGRQADRCSLPDTMDLTFGHIPTDGTRNPPHLVESKFPRFCDEIRYGTPSYGKYFRRVFVNKTFRVYQVKPWKGKFT